VGFIAPISTSIFFFRFRTQRAIVDRLNDMTDAKLLRQYFDADSEDAFAELVKRHADWIYGSALRMVRDPHLAEDVTQAVFMVLAQNGRKVGQRPLNAWLFGVMRYSAIHARRIRERQQRHERQAAEMTAQNADSQQPEMWEELAGRLEESVWRLGRQERQAVLLRFYQQKSLAEVGEALGVSEDAARKRVAKAVGQLKKMLGTVEIIGSAELSETFMQRITHPASASVKVSSARAHSTTAGGATVIAKGAMTMMLVTKLKIAAAGLIVLALIPSAVAVVMAAREPVAAHSAAATQPTATQMTLALRIKAASNLRQIGQALLLYSNENVRAYPPTLGDLIRYEAIPPEIFVLPHVDKQPPANVNRQKFGWVQANHQREELAKWVNANTDFAYYGGGLTSNSAVSTILVAQKVPLSGDTTLSLLFANGRSVSFPRELVEQLLAQNSQPMITVAETAPTPQELENRRACAGNLRNIWQMILLYRYSHASKYPPNLDALQIGPQGNPPYDFNALQHLGENIDEACWSAFDKRVADFRKLEPESTPLPAWIFKQDDYIYIGNQPQPGDKDKNHGDGVNILFADGHVRWYSLAQAHELIQKNGSPSRR
jgi:RNA polymerase sigma factor (sigma-70 family)